MNRTVRCLKALYILSASAQTSFRSLIPLITALICTKWASVVFAMICANVVFPVPGGPERMMEESVSCSMAERSAVPSPTTCSCPMKSWSFWGLRRNASGASAIAMEERSIQDGEKNPRIPLRKKKQECLA